MPPLQALAALHGLWILVLLPPVAWAAHRWPSSTLCLVGTMLTALGLLGLAAVAAQELLTWLPTVSGDTQRYLPQRILYVLGTLTDIPILQLTGAGLACWLAGWWRSSRVPSFRPPAALRKDLDEVGARVAPDSGGASGATDVDDNPLGRAAD
ncbi:MAG: hypothetical protein L0Z62_35445 [Gemmataceae bacterium]|nr:hypothetical protein [Gemmataceae bacterium]